MLKAVFAFNCSISYRAQLAKEMHIEKLMKEKQGISAVQYFV